MIINNLADKNTRNNTRLCKKWIWNMEYPRGIVHYKYDNKKDGIQKIKQNKIWWG